MEKIDCLVIGAGVVGLACARALARGGRDVIVIERENTVGTGISSRNSEVIHAGMYYPKNSLKAQLCVRGNRLLRDYAQSCKVPFFMPGKLIVATDDAEKTVLHGILKRGHENGVTGLRAISAQDARALEPNVTCVSALFSPDTGIIDSHALMLSFQGEAEEAGAIIAFETPAVGGRIVDGGVEIETGGREPMRLLARYVVIAAGLRSCAIAQMLGLPNVPAQYLCKGSYFTLTGKMPFRRLVYPVPVAGGLGLHYTVDMAGRGRFGPDVEWIEKEDYAVDPARGRAFYRAIRRYWPELPDNALEPGYSGIRPKLSAAGEPAADFAISGRAAHGAPNVTALYGIESPGLTASLAIAGRVAEMAA